MLFGIKQDFRNRKRRKIGMVLIKVQTGFCPVFRQVRNIPPAIIKPLLTFEAGFHANLIADSIPENFLGS